MDLFLLNGETDDLSLQDMIEKDMRSEFGMATFDDFAADFSLNTFENDVCMKTLEPLFEGLPGIIDMDLPSIGGGGTPSTNSCCSSSTNSSTTVEDDHHHRSRLALEDQQHDLAWFGSSSNRDLTFDIDTAIMVNPSSVLPSTLPSRQYSSSSSSSASSSASSTGSSVSPLLSSSPSPLLSSSPVLLSSSVTPQSSPLLLSSAHTITTNTSNFINTASSNINMSPTQTVYIKTETLQNAVTSSSTVQMSQCGSGTQVTVLRPTSTTSNNTLVSSNSMSPTIIATPRQQHHSIASQQQHRVQISNSLSSSNNNQSVASPSARGSIVAHNAARLAAAAAAQSSHQIVTSASAVHTTSNGAHQHIFRGKPSIVRNAGIRKTDERALPKPAYSYSCLIALALKNSNSGSLPVSEIYSFMCEHFPYFRTAPNGWKNSVRHNLSLNKCFEKIEKPVVSGNNQRKGCLWALNPSKVHKMDEEIIKWSKKDLQGIKDAMSSPEVLGALERGEMKFEAASSTSSCDESEDEDEEVDALTLSDPPTTLATLKFVNSTHLAPTSRTGTLLTQQQQQQQRTTLQIHTTNKQQPAILRQNSLHHHHHHQQQSINKLRAANAVFTTTNSSASNSSPARQQEPQEYILPDSTMTEISFQANGAILDDLGNEITIEEEEVVSSSNNSSSSIASMVSSPRSLVLRKLPLTTPVVRSPALRTNYVYSSPHQHHNINRLVLTNAKIA